MAGAAAQTRAAKARRWASKPSVSRIVRRLVRNGNSTVTESQQRSIAFATLAPLLEVTGCSFYSLQKGDDAVKQLRDSIWRDRVIDFTDELHDFSDTAALIENLDLVIAVDTSVLHLAGALAKPVWLLNRHNTCWRWLRDREDSPWYPSLRQFRQDATRDWDQVVRHVADALRERFVL